MTAGRRAALTLLTGSTAVQAASNALAAVLATMLLGPADRGAMVLGLTISGVAAVAGGLGTGSAFRARLPGAGGSRRDVVAAYTWLSLSAAGLGSVAAVVACAASASFIDPMLARPPFLAGVAVATVGQLALAQQTDAWFAAGLFRAGGGWGAVAATAGLVAMLAAAVAGPAAWVLLLAQGLGTVGVAGVAGWRLWRSGLVSFARPAGQELAGLLRVGVPVLGATVGFILAMRADRLVLGAVAGVGAVGVYSLAATLGEIPRLLPAAVGQLVMRDVALGTTRDGIRRAVRLAVGLTVAAGVAIAVAGWVLIGPVFGPEFAAARPVLIVLLVAEVCLVPYGLAIRGLMGGGWTRVAGTLGGVGGLVGLVLFGLVIARWGLAGAAVASTVLYAGLSLASWSMLRRRLTPPVSTVVGAHREPDVLDAPAALDAKEAVR